MKLTNWLAIGLSVPPLVWLLCGCQKSTGPDALAEGIPATVALYSDRGCGEESVQAAEKMFQWIGYTVSRLDADYINSESLDTFSILCVPGGDMYRYAQDISLLGKDNIRGFVSNGGGYIGICGGAYFAGEKVFWRGNQLSMTSLHYISARRGSGQLHRSLF